MSEAKTTVYQTVTDQLIQRLESGVAPWRKPWSASRSDSGRDRNPVTGTVYKGINRIMTGFAGYASPLWVSFKQAQELGGTVKRGEKGTLIVYYGRKEGEQNAETGEVEGGYLFARKSYVFNLEQTEGLADRFALPVEPRTEFQRVEAAERIASSYLISGPSMKHQGAQAFYAPQSDLVAMPPRSTFESAGGYYSTLFHELAHSTGHRARLNRDSLTSLASFGSHEYSREELVAEMTAAFLLAETGIDCSSEFDNSAAYLAGWIKVLKGDSKLAIQAASAAEKAANWIQGII